jgi:peroxiredoxin
MNRRVLVLPIAAVAIGALCAYKLSRSDEKADPNRPFRIIRQAPLFVLYDQRETPQLTWLKSFLGRHEIVLVFFNEKVGMSDPVLVWLRQHAAKLRRENVKVFAISRGLPQDHRKMLKEGLAEDEPVPFQMLSDLDGKVHQQYGLVKPEAQRPEAGVFLIDRAGNMLWNQKHPLPLDDPIRELEQKFGRD